jgi:tetratricopeptide (TPR) repeat protein
MKKIFPILLIGTLVMGGAVLLAIWKASPTSSEDFLESGKKYYSEKKYSEAAIQLQNALKKDERNREARYLLALTYLNEPTPNLNAAAKHLMALLEFYPEDKEANLQLGNLYLQVGTAEPRYFMEAAQIAAKILQKEPDNVPALILAGNAAAGQKDYSESLESYEKVVRLDPNNAPVFVSIGAAQTFQKHYPEAEKAFLRARELDPNNKAALLSLANYYRAAGDTPKAETSFKEALATYPADPVIYTQIVQLYYQSDRFDEGVKLLQEIQAKDPKVPTPSLILGDMYLAKNRVNDAKELLLNLKKTYPQNIEVATRLAVVLMGIDVKQADVEVQRILKADPSSPVGNLLQGEIQLFEGKIEEAQATFLKPQVANSALAEAQFFLGNLAARKGDLDKAQTYLEKSLRINPRYVAARVALAEILLAGGKAAEGRKELQEALQMQRDFVPARLLMASLNRSEKRYGEAETELDALAKEQPLSAAIQRQRALLFDERGQAANTEKSLNRALELEPTSLETFAALIQFDVKNKQYDKAIQRINAVPEDKKVAYHYELLGAVYTEAGKPREAEAALKKASEKDPKRTNADSLLASQYIKNGRLDEGLGKLDDLIKKNPSNGGAYGTKGVIYEQQGKMAEAKESYLAALRADPKLDAAANNLAYIYAEEGQNLETAFTLAQNARKNQPSNPDVADTLGWVYHKLGNQVLAKEQVQFAISKQSDNPTLHYHLGMIYKTSKQLKEAETEFRKALALPAPKAGFKEKTLAENALKEVTNSR